VARERLEVVEPKPDLAALKAGELLLRNPRQPHEFGARHAACLAGVIEPGRLPGRSNRSRHGPIVTDSVPDAKRNRDGFCNQASVRSILVDRPSPGQLA